MASAGAMLERSLDSGSAKEAFLRMIAQQGGKLNKPLLTGTLPLAPKHAVTATRGGYVEAVDCIAIGETVVSLGGGRRKTGDEIDPSVGIEMNVAVGDRVEAGDLLMRLHCSAETANNYTTRLQESVRLVDQSVAPHPLVLERRPSRPLGESH